MAEKQIDPNDTGVIRVQGHVYNKISEMAEREERTMGGQVAYMVKTTTCIHPIEYREAKHILVFPVAQANKSKAAHLGKGQKQRGFKCSLCNQLVIPDLPEEINQLVNTAETVS